MMRQRSRKSSYPKSILLAFGLAASLGISNTFADATNTTPPTPPELPFLFGAFTPPQTQTPTGEITQDITRVFTTTGTATAQQLMTGVRSLVEALIIDSLDSSLYLQGIPGAGQGGSGPPDPIYNMVVNHFSEFCAQGTPEANNNPACSADLMFQHADLKLSSVLSGSFLDTNRMAAAQSFVNNLIDPFPNSKFQAGTYPDPNLNKPTAITLQRIQNEPALRQDLANAYVRQALLSVARQAFAEMIARRNIAPNAGQQTQMEIFEQQACSRFYDTDWQCNMKIYYLTAMNKTDKNDPKCSPAPANLPGKPDYPGAATIDNAIQMATNNCLAFERFKQGELIQALLAAQVAQNDRQAQAASSVLAGSQPNMSAVTQQPSGGANTGAAPITPPAGSMTGGTTSGGTTPNTTNTGNTATPYYPTGTTGTGTTGTTPPATGTTTGTQGATPGTQTPNNPYGLPANTGTGTTTNTGQ